MMVFSVIIPVYNSEKYLEKCICSIINQSYASFEVLLINDGSYDNSAQICEEYAKKDSRVRVFHQKNAGVSVARNKGLDNALGKWIVFVDSDDWVEDNYFQTLANSVSVDPDVDIHLFGCFKVNEKEKTNFISFENEIYQKDKINSLLENTFSNMKLFWFPYTKVFSAELLFNIRFSERVFIGEDTIFSLEAIGNSKKIKFLDCNLYNYYSNPDSVTNSAYHVGLLSNMESHYNIRKDIIINKLRIISSDSRLDCAKYYVNHILFWLLENLKNAPDSIVKFSEIEAIRNSIIYQECFLDYEYSWMQFKRSILIKLFELRWYKLLFKLLKINN